MDKSTQPPEITAPYTEASPNYSPVEIGSNGRNRKGQFLPGLVANPNGRPLGSRNRASLLARALLETRAAEITQKVMDEALKGNPIAYKLCIERLVPIPQDAPIDLELPEMAPSYNKSNPIRMFETQTALLKAVASGEVPPREAQSVSTPLEARRRSWEALVLNTRLNELEDNADSHKK